MTNFEKITKTPTALAEYLSGKIECCVCNKCIWRDRSFENCGTFLLHWLNKEVEEDVKAD